MRVVVVSTAGTMITRPENGDHVSHPALIPQATLLFPDRSVIPCSAGVPAGRSDCEITEIRPLFGFRPARYTAGHRDRRRQSQKLACDVLIATCFYRELLDVIALLSPMVQTTFFNSSPAGLLIVD